MLIECGTSYGHRWDHVLAVLATDLHRPHVSRRRGHRAVSRITLGCNPTELCANIGRSRSIRKISGCISGL